jgi:hypothetical protein
LNCTDPTPLLDFVRGKASNRKLRLFAIACCHRLHHVMDDAVIRRRLQVAEQHAEGQATDAKLMAVWTDRWNSDTSVDTEGWRAVAYAVLLNAVDAAEGSRFAAMSAASNVPHLLPDLTTNPAWHVAVNEERLAQSKIGRDIFGNPFRKVQFLRDWLTSTVIAVANSIYDERSFDRLPILANALQDAGCDNADILNHCRGEAPHVRGCWVVDLLLGKE